MNVGILSMQRVYNYGSFLQAYSLKNRIEELGHKCEFIDIKPGRKLEMHSMKDSNKKKSYINKIDKHFIKRVEHVIFSKRRSKLYEEKLFKELGLNQQEIEKFDVVVIGSDEVFNCLQDAKWGFSTQLLGDGIDADKIITYAASCGFTTYEKLKSAKLEEEVRGYLKNINSFSVRDKNTEEFVKKLTEKEPIMHLDPVLIGNIDKKTSKKVKEQEYIVIYGYDNRINDQNEINEIKQFAKQNNLKTIGVGFYQRWCDKNILVEPFELLEYFKNAAYIITDTFHGTIFSIKLNKPFATIIRDSNREKLFYLLDKFSLTDREVIDISQLDKILKETIDFRPANNLIEKETKRSIEYLKKNLG